jgi:hypothetical protein
VVNRHSLFGLFVLLILAARGWGWGEEGHRIVTEAAAKGSAEPLGTFYRAQLPFLLDHASDPDDWSVIDPDEARRHYLDLELLGEDALSNLPATYEDARARYGEETLKQAGTLPWTILDYVRDLTEAERADDWERSALLAAVLSHYVADACMPLHTTVNYKGQQTGNLILDDRTEHRHVHLRFEVGMLRAFEPEIRERVFARVRQQTDTRPAKDVSDPVAIVRELLRESRSRIAPLLQADKELTTKWEGRFGPQFYRDMYEGTGELATEQLARAAEATASLWLYAWQAAGRPQLPERRVAFGEQVVLVERGQGQGGSPSALDRRETKVFRYKGLGYVLVTADWRAAGRFQAGRQLQEEEYQVFWRSLESAGVWEVTEGGPEVQEVLVTLAVAHSGRERRLALVARAGPSGVGRFRDERARGVIEAIRAVAPETPGPEQPVKSPTSVEPSAPAIPAGAATKGAGAIP